MSEVALTNPAVLTTIDALPISTPLALLDGTKVAPSPITAEDKEFIAKAVATLMPNPNVLPDSMTLTSFGDADATELTQISEQMLQGVRAKDTGTAGQLMIQMTNSIRGLDTTPIKNYNPDQKQSWIARHITHAVSPIAAFFEQYDTVLHEVDVAAATLEKHRTALYRDLVSYERQYAGVVIAYHKKQLGIQALSMVQAAVKQNIIPALQVQAAATNDMLDAQKLRDAEARVSEIDHKISDFEFNITVLGQAFPAISLDKENDTALVRKIASQINGTLPLWKQQLATAVGRARAREAASASKAVSDLQNELLVANAEALKLGTAEIRTEVERGIFDIEAVEKANNLIIEALQETLTIEKQGREKRAEAHVRLEACNEKLKQSLLTFSKGI